MRQSVKIFISLVVLGLCACSVSHSPRPTLLQLKLLPPADAPEVSLLKQKITMQSQGLDQQFVAVLRLQRDRLKLAALSATGQQLFFLEYDGEQLIQKNASSVDIPGRDILAIMQFALWSPSSIQQYYRKEGGWIVDIAAQQRSLLTSSGLLLKVTYQDDTVVIENYRHDYRLKIQPLEN